MVTRMLTFLACCYRVELTLLSLDVFTVGVLTQLSSVVATCFQEREWERVGVVGVNHKRQKMKRKKNIKRSLKIEKI
jgi:hypothetical protein